MAGFGLVGAAHGAAGAEKAALAESPKNEEMKMKNQWVQEHLTDVKAKLPFSFVYDGKASEALLSEWAKKVDTKKLDANRTEHTMRWTDPKSGLEVRCVAMDYADYPAAEWTVYFKNTGTNNTPILENIQGLDARFERDGVGEFVLNGIFGDYYSADSYHPYALTLGPNTANRFAPDGGRPTNGRFPYYNLQMPGRGLLLAIGWPGQWAASFTRDATNGLRIVAGQELTHLTLKPGEEIRTPLIAMLFWRGADVVSAQNLWRRWMIAHNLPRPGGKLPELFDSICMGTRQSEKSEVQGIDAYLKGGVKHDYWWMDAGWYPGNGWGEGRGTWEPDPGRFPNGIKAVSDYAHSKGMKLVLWFEPETVDKGSWVARNHPDWVLGGRLLNLGNPAAIQWLTDHVIRFVAEQGVDLYRQDFNQDPLDCWRKNDAPDRQGMTENLHVLGYLAFWDALRRKYPDMLIDSCASGGRRNDLETLRRGVPLLRSDYQAAQLNSDVSEGNQGHTYGIAMWIPYYGTGEYYNDAYSFRSHMSPAMGVGYAPGKPIDWEALRRTIACWREAAPNYYGDYYPLTEYSLGTNQWMAWQFNRPEQGAGMVQAFRRAGAPVEEMRFKLKGLEADAIYAVRDLDKTGSEKVSGRELMETGMLVKIPPRGAAVILYSHLSAVATTDVTHGEAPLKVRFDGTSSASASGKVVSYDWAFGDGASARDAMATHTYEKPGTYTASLTVKNEQGRSVVGEVTVAVSPVDDIAPALVAVKPVRADRMVVTFSKPVQKADAEGTNNYAITPGVQVLAASLGTDLRTVTLTTSPLASPFSSGGEYTLTVKNIRDCAQKPNTIAADTSRTFGYSSPLFARWKLDEQQGAAAADVSGSKLGGVLKGAPVWTNMAGRAGLSFDGVDDIVEMPTRLESLAVPFTFTFWVNPAAEQVEYADILGNHAGLAGLVMQQDVNKTNQFHFGYGDGTYGYGPGSVQLIAGAWQHVAVVCDDGKSVCYVNGAEKSSGAGSGVFAPNPNLTFRLGQGYFEKRFFRGMLSDVRIYRTALSAAEVQAVMKE
jgi:alpha-galactosidase